MELHYLAYGSVPVELDVFYPMLLKFIEKHKEDDGEFFGSIRCGEWCFEFCIVCASENKEDMFLDVRAYVGGVDTGYSDTDYPYDFRDGFTLEYDNPCFKFKDANLFEIIIYKEIESFVKADNNFDDGETGWEKANKKMVMW